MERVMNGGKIGGGSVHSVVFGAWENNPESEKVKEGVRRVLSTAWE